MMVMRPIVARNHGFFDGKFGFPTATKVERRGMGPKGMRLTRLSCKKVEI